MTPETYNIKFAEHTITAVLDHATAMDIIHANGHELNIPAEKGRSTKCKRFALLTFPLVPAQKKEKENKKGRKKNEN